MHSCDKERAMKSPVRSLALLSLVLVPLTIRAQETQTPPEQPNRTYGYVDFGFRGIFGDVYGRRDLPFEPELKNSKLNEYRDLRDGFFIRNAHLQIDNLFGTNSYFTFMSQKAIYRDQGYLSNIGEWGKYKVQFRYDQIPHVFSNTTRTLYTYNGHGAWTIPTVTRNAFQTLAVAGPAGCPAAPGPTRGCNLPSSIETQVEPQLAFMTPRLDRRAGMFAVEYDLTPDIAVFGSFRREHASGFRPLGIIFNSSPSASLNGGYGAEVPEAIDYFTNDATAGVEVGGGRWGAQLSYIGSFFNNNVNTMLVDNPFLTTDACTTPAAGCQGAATGPAGALYDLYPNNHANYFSFAGKLNLGYRTNLMASISPGWIRQDDDFVPYTSNTLLLPLTGALPATSLGGEKQTLAMNYTVASNFFKNFIIKTQYRHYDYNNNTPDLFFTPVQGDTGAPGSAAENRKPSYNRKNVQVIGEWLFGAKKDNMIKAGYEGEWMDRTHRDVHHSNENSFVTGVGVKPLRQISFDANYRYAVRDPEDYEDELVAVITGGMPLTHPLSRRFDEASRIRHRVEGILTFDPTDRLSFSGFASTTQDDYNQRGGVNSSTPLNFISGNYIDYHLYGLLKDLSYLWGADANVVLTDKASFFAEYSHERYYHSMVSRARNPGSGIAPGVLLASNCGLAGQPCDSPNNDWASAARDIVDVGTVGFDVNPIKRTTISSYYSLSFGKGEITTRPLGNPALTGVDQFILNGTNSATDYPETTNRVHEVGAIFRFKINDRLAPKVEYRFQQWDNKDYQTTPMTQYMGCFSPIPNAPVPTNSVPGCTTPVLLTNTASPAGSPTPFYPYVAVGDSGAARYLLLGADQPSYRSHYLAATLDFHF
jgi:MtrB/PioB family decaheme-associated outer membrane protein